MLTKSARYYWDKEAVSVPQVEYERNRRLREMAKGLEAIYPIASEGKTGQSPQGAWGTVKSSKARHDLAVKGIRNIRSVWSFPTQSFPKIRIEGKKVEHFAVFPEKLPELCIKAATPEVGCCAECGAPWGKVIVRTGHINKRELAHVPNNTPTKTDSTGWAPLTKATDEWQPTCKCNADKVPSIVLDPFSGAGTTLYVAKKLNRQAIGFEISEEYCALSNKRNMQQVMV